MLAALSIGWCSCWVKTFFIENKEQKGEETNIIAFFIVFARTLSGKSYEKYVVLLFDSVLMMKNILIHCVHFFMILYLVHLNYFICTKMKIISNAKTYFQSS